MTSPISILVTLLLLSLQFCAAEPQRASNSDNPFDEEATAPIDDPQANATGTGTNSASNTATSTSSGIFIGSTGTYSSVGTGTNTSTATAPTYHDAFWYLGAEGQSCEEVCKEKGGFSTAGATKAAALQSPDFCKDVLEKLKVDVTIKPMMGPCDKVVGLGCLTYPKNDAARQFYVCTGTWTAAAKQVDVKRACPCVK